MEVNIVQDQARPVACGYALQLQQRLSFLPSVGGDRWRRRCLAVATEVSGDALRMPRDFARRADGDNATLMQYCNAVGERKHPVDVVLDQQDGVFHGKAFDKPGDALP